jgi:hypothetical protein
MNVAPDGRENSTPIRRHKAGTLLKAIAYGLFHSPTILTKGVPLLACKPRSRKHITGNFREAIGLVHLLKAYPKDESQKAGIVRKGYKVVCNVFEDCYLKKDNFACSMLCPSTPLFPSPSQSSVDFRTPFPQFSSHEESWRLECHHSSTSAASR